MIAFLYIFTVAQAVALLFVVVRLDRLTRAAKHHEHVLRLHLSEEGFPRMVLDEEAWDPRDRLIARKSAPFTRKDGGSDV